MSRLLLVLVLCACRHSLPPLPGQGGPAWIEVESEHFTVWTAGSRERARELVRQLEHLRQVILGVGFSGSKMEGRSFVVALASEDEIALFLPENVAAYADVDSPLQQAVVVIPLDAREHQTHIVTHELVHVIAFNVIRNQPPWFAEGIAEFFATVGLDADRARGDVGKLPRVRVDALRRGTLLSIPKMLACQRRTSCEVRKDSMFYPTAWAMFAYLANKHPRELIAYATRLDELPPERAHEAFAQAFPTLTPSTFDREVRTWLRYGNHTIWKFDVKLRQWPITERVLSDADVQSARAYLGGASRASVQTPVLAGALANEPDHLVANLLEYARTRTIAVEVARRISTAHADDWRAWWLVGEAVRWQGDDATTARRKACALLAARPSAWVPRELCAAAASEEVLVPQ